jgi:hypothetical protein
LIVETDSDASKMVTFGPNGLLGSVVGAFGARPEHAALVAAEADVTPTTRKRDATDAPASAIRITRDASTLKARLRCDGKGDSFRESIRGKPLGFETLLIPGTGSAPRLKARSSPLLEGGAASVYA